MGCRSLKDMYCHAEEVPYTWSDPFYDTPINRATLHVPVTAIENYKATKPWSEFGSIVPLTDEETDIHNLKAENGGCDAFFDLAGRRVQKGQKGLIIENGRKVLQK